MDRKLEINADSCVINIGKNSFKVNNQNLEEVISANMPGDLEKYENYRASVSVVIKVQEVKGLEVKTEGYKREEREETNECQNNQ